MRLFFFDSLNLDSGLRLYRRHSRLPVLFVEAYQRELTLPFGVFVLDGQIMFLRFGKEK
jgi:hypothetical protein